MSGETVEQKLFTHGCESHVNNIDYCMDDSNKIL